MREAAKGSEFQGWEGYHGWTHQICGMADGFEEALDVKGVLSKDQAQRMTKSVYLGDSCDLWRLDDHQHERGNSAWSKLYGLMQGVFQCTKDAQSRL